MWISGTVSFLFGVFQALLLKKMLFSLTGGNPVKACFFLLAKFILYAGALALLVFRFSQYTVVCAVGYAAGLPLMVLLFFAYKTFGAKTDFGDGQNENHNHS